MGFEFATAGRIVFGRRSAAQLVKIVAEMGAKRPFVVTGRRGPRHEMGIQGTIFRVSGEPTVEAVRDGTAVARECDLVVGMGGGSVIDGAKAIAAMATNPGDPLDYLEVIGKGQALMRQPLPFIAIPTTAGTGSEVTRNAVLGSPEHGVKASLRSAMMLAKVAIVDPELTRDVPPEITASTGLDALTQVIEPFVTPRANAMTDGFCRDGMKRAAAYLERAYRNGADLEAREQMSLAALDGGLALANAGLGVVHGFAAPIGGMFDAPHGAVCAALLPHGMRANIRALRERSPANGALERYGEVARILTGDAGASAEDGAEWVGRLCERLSVRALRAYGIGERDITGLVEKAARASSMKANPIVLTPGELAAVLERAV